MKALLLFSGGLDSIIAAKILREAGSEVEALHFINPFLQNPAASLTGVKQTAVYLNIPLRLEKLDEDYLRLIENPPHGYGKHANPCLDCRIYQLRKAKEKMAAVGASFIATGEVLDQRPNSQRRDALDIVERDADLKGLLVRPLSARQLRPTIPEQEGWLDREKLLDLKGRGRSRQLALAAGYGITDYPAPAGGCLLTSREYAAKIRDLLKYQSKLDLRAVELLRWGRHLRPAPHVKLIIGRNQSENAVIESLAGSADILLRVKEYASPTTLYSGPSDESLLGLAAAITAGFCKAPPETGVQVELTDNNGGSLRELTVIPLPRNEIHHFLITEPD